MATIFKETQIRNRNGQSCFLFWLGGGGGGHKGIHCIVLHFGSEFQSCAQGLGMDLLEALHTKAATTLNFLRFSGSGCRVYSLGFNR